jgi:AcrR family transcriptional regulator
VIFSQASSADPHERLQTALRQHLEHYRDEAKIMGVIEQVSRYDDHVAAVRSARNQLHRDQMERSIRGMQRRGIADPSLDPKIAAAALGSMVERFAEMALAQGQLNSKLDDAADTLATLFVNALQMKVRRSRS